MDLEDIQRGRPGVGPGLARAGLRVLSWGWDAAQRCKRVAYAAGLRRRVWLDVPVLSVGNIAVGGTGKTPFVAWLVAHLRAAGRAPGILARGYGESAAEAGGLNDEGAVLEHVLGAGMPQVQDPDRVRGGRALLAAHPQVDVLVLDDGFQHWRLQRDLDIVLLDATRPFGHGHLLPRGQLREAPAALARAGAIVLTRTERVRPEELENIARRVAALSAAPVCHARTEAVSLADDLAGAAVLACCGIGHPAAFLGTLEDLGARVVARRILPDHRGIPEDAWPALLAEAKAAGAECIAITRKDAVKVRRLPPEVTVVDVETVIVRGEDALQAAIAQALSARAGQFSSGSSSSGSVRS